MDTAIGLTGVSKAFGKFRAVDNLTLSVPRGAMFGLLGPNGAGKTTTIRMIMNITAPDSGDIRILGHPMDRRTQNRIGYLPEERGLYRKMKVIDHLYFLAAIKEVGRDEARRRIDDWLDKMELRPWLNKKVDELSKGMQQKIQFIATIVHDPDILILDEPFSGLDPINVALMRDFFVEFRQRGKTIIFCTHVLEQAEKLCDEICLMARSRKILEGSLKELKRRYSQDLLRLSVDASLADVQGLPGVASAKALNGTFVVGLTPGADRREFLRRALERYRIDSFSQKEPELEEIYIDAVKSAGIEDRTIE
ncbi:MAG TPA: ATP-binding cassette domain-containing protein [Thermoanaerobaculia bacterium]|jgi:ABC-2 type transport system ATP-binding protein|nr:ATP-binding cassette domain-containing protein [Thermoanaerobaculia bacterium]